MYLTTLTTAGLTACLIGATGMAQDPGQTLHQAAAPPAEPAVAPVVIADVEAEPHIVELVICLDTSGSMSGLINAARQKLWAVINDLALAEPTPELRVALYTFGNDGHNAEDGWVHQQTPFTTDLDLVSERLFALTTNGGTEFVGRVLDRAVEQLEWTPSDSVLKLIIVAGNESADQDQQVSFRDACKKSISKGIMINSIYCGNPADNLAPAWQEVAKLADGHWAAIDQNNGTVVITTPFDDELATLSAKVNATYIPYGAQGLWGSDNQLVQDRNALGLNSAAAAQRAQTKCSGLYDNRRWDLVDACSQQDFELASIKVEDLPENMQKMTEEERTAYVDAKAVERKQIIETVNDLNTKRNGYVQEQMKKSALDDSQAFDLVIRNALRDQARSKGFTFADDVAEDAAEEAAEPVVDAGAMSDC